MSAKTSKQPVHVIVITDADGDVFSEVLELYEHSLDVFKKQKGFVSASIYKSQDTDRIVSFLQWETKDDHLACLSSADWQTAPGSARWYELMQTGKIRMRPELVSQLA